MISKLTDGKATHVPFRNSKLTRLLQSSLSGQGRVSVSSSGYCLKVIFFHFWYRNHLCIDFVQLICTVTPASSNSEEAHNTLKFAHRSKHIEIQALQNKVDMLA